MVNNHFNFKRVADAFDDMARGDKWDNKSGNEEVFILDEEEDKKEEESENGGKYFETEGKEELVKLLRIKEDDGVKMNIHAVVKEACIELCDFSSSPASYIRRLMALLRHRGLDAGICKSKWETKRECPSGSYEYIDVGSNTRRFILEVSLATHFEIARPTDSYVSLLQFFPQIFVGEVQEIKKIVRLMCDSIKASMKKGGISIPPWRRCAYMQAKWLGPYKRSINELPKAPKAFAEDLAIMKSTGFVVARSPISYCLREDFARAC